MEVFTWLLVNKLPFNSSLIALKWKIYKQLIYLMEKRSSLKPPLSLTYFLNSALVYLLESNHNNRP